VANSFFCRVFFILVFFFFELRVIRAGPCFWLLRHMFTGVQGHTGRELPSLQALGSLVCACILAFSDGNSIGLVGLGFSPGYGIIRKS
jgi:hypothetical protein